MPLFGGIELPGHPDLSNIRRLDLLPSRTIREMQQYGFAIDRDAFASISATLRTQISDLREEICTYIPPDKLEEFIARSNLDEDAYLPMNVDSNVQLAHLLFDVLRIGSGRELKRTKSGEQISTGRRQLEQIKIEHPIVGKILNYREVTKLETTYANKLPRMAVRHPSGSCWCGLRHTHDTLRIHTEILSTRTETGRYASKNPNLQNLPVRSKLGAAIRAAFIASPGTVLIAVDFSQIELRMLAFLAHVKKMIEVFLKDLDIHTFTAMEAFNLAEDEVLADKIRYRNPSKNVNFAVVFGETELGLYEQLVADSYGKAGIPVPNWLTREWCGEFLEKWFGIYTEVQPYMDEQEYRARKYGFVWDAFGRIRYVPEVYSTHSRIYSAGIRQAGNMPIQGCLPKDTRILTPRGWVRVDEWNNDKLWTGERWAEARKLNMGKAKRIRIHLSDGRTFDCDNRHKLLAKGNAWHRWVDVMESLGKELVRDQSIPDWGRPDEHTVTDWYWAGRMIGDGYLGKRQKHWYICFSDYEREDVIRFMDWLETKDFKGKTNSILGWNVADLQYSGFRIGGGTSKGMKFWKSFGFHEIKDSGIPDKVFQLDQDRRQAFFDGYYDADGYHHPKSPDRRKGCKGTTGKTYIKSTSRSRKLTQDILRLAQTLGITGNMLKPQTKGESTWYDVGFHQSPHPLVVDKIEELGEEIMYTFSVSDEKHAFSSEGLISKNTASELIKLAMGMVQEWIEQDIRPRNIHCRPLLTIHDELILEVDEDWAEILLPIIELKFSEVLTDQDTGMSLCPIPIKAEGTISPRWEKG